MEAVQFIKQHVISNFSWLEMLLVVRNKFKDVQVGEKYEYKIRHGKLCPTHKGFENGTCMPMPDTTLSIQYFLERFYDES